MSEHLRDSEDYPLDGGYAREVRDIIFKSTLTGVAATMLAVTIFSPAGFGGIVGTSLASGLGIDSNSAPADDVYANLPAYPAPLTEDEVADIHQRIAFATTSVDMNRAATEATVNHIRIVALSDGIASFAPVPAPEHSAFPVLARASQVVLPEPMLAELELVEPEPTEMGIFVVDYSMSDVTFEPYAGANLELSTIFDGNETL
jgi:hypothetical protein